MEVALAPSGKACINLASATGSTTILYAQEDGVDRKVPFQSTCKLLVICSAADVGEYLNHDTGIRAGVLLRYVIHHGARRAKAVNDGDGINSLPGVSEPSGRHRRSRGELRLCVALLLLLCTRGRLSSLSLRLRVPGALRCLACLASTALLLLLSLTRSRCFSSFPLTARLRLACSLACLLLLLCSRRRASSRCCRACSC